MIEANEAWQLIVAVANAPAPTIGDQYGPSVRLKPVLNIIASHADGLRIEIVDTDRGFEVVPTFRGEEGGDE